MYIYIYKRKIYKLEGMKYSRKKRIYTYLYPLLSRMIFEYMRDLKYKISEEKKHNNPYTTFQDNLII